MKDGFYTSEMKRLTMSPEALQKREVTRSYHGGVKIYKLLGEQEGPPLK